MTAANTTTSRLRPLIFTFGIALAFVAIYAIVMALTWNVLVTSQDNTVFAESQSASQPDSPVGNIDVQDVTLGGGGEDAAPDLSPANQAPGAAMNNMTTWLTRMAIGLSSDSAVSYLAYVYSIAPPDQMSTTPTWTISE